jgi:hypothetical protein
MLTRRHFVTIGLVLPALALLTKSALAYGNKVFSTNGIAINGYDPVAYLSQNAAVKGSKDFSLMYGGATWLFSSVENRERYEMDARQNCPQFGGFCAFAVAHGQLAPSDPNAFEILDGKLYLFNSINIAADWRKDAAGNILKAKANWPGLAH